VDIINSVQRQNADNSPITFNDALEFFHNPSNKEWVLVYDNVDDNSLKLSKYLPKCQHGSIIITTRNQLLGQLTPKNELHIKLGPMSNAEAIESIYKSSDLGRSEEHRPFIASIATELGNLPVALIQAGSYILRTLCTPEEYLMKLQSHKVELMKRTAGDREDQSAYAAFELSYRQLPLSARNFLHILSYLHHNDFPLEIISHAAGHKFRLRPFSLCKDVKDFERSAQLLWDTFYSAEGSIELTLDSIITTLQNYSMATFYRTSIGLVLRIHPLNHLWAYHCQSSHQRLVYMTAAVRLIVSAFTSKHHYVYLIPHIAALIPNYAHADISLNDCGAFGTILMRTQQLENAGAVWQNICQELIRKGEVKGLINGFYLAWIIASKYLQSFPLYLGIHIKAIKHSLKRLDVLRALANYAATYYLQGFYAVAEKLQRHVVKELAIQLGRNNEETVKAKGELALTYQIQQKYFKAKALQEEVLQQLRAILGNDHSEVLGAMANLAISNRSLGNYVYAQELQEEIWEKRKLEFGETHWETLKAGVNLAKTLHTRGHYTPAMKLQEKIWDARIIQLGKSHLKTLEVMAHLAITYRSQGDYPAAEDMQKYILDQRKAQLGEFHPSTSEAMDQLGLTYHSQGRYLLAENMQRRVLEERIARLGNSHPDTIRAMINLAITFRSVEKYTRALQMQKKVMEIRSVSLGEFHPETLEAMTNISITYCQIGTYGLAFDLQLKVLLARSRIWGRDHPETLKAMLNVADTHHCMREYKDAMSLQKHAVGAMTQHLGENHVDTLEAISCLAITYGSQGDYIASEVLQKHVLEKLLAQLGEDHQSVQRAKANLAKTHILKRHYASAANLLQEVLDWRVLNLGMTHLDTITTIEDLRVLYEHDKNYKQALKLMDDLITALESKRHSPWHIRNAHRWKRKFMRLAERIAPSKRSLGEACWKRVSAIGRSVKYHYI
jgi:tetratricopeptide (TPR) repeat protein